MLGLTDLFLVHCPRCDKCAQVVLEPGSKIDTPQDRYKAVVWGGRLLVCANCGYNARWTGKKPNEEHFGYDWYFDRPLWLSTPCCGETLWALNGKHLDFLESFVSLKLRPAARNSYANYMSRKLPGWILSAKNRDEILRCIKKLRQTIPETNYA